MSKKKELPGQISIDEVLPEEKEGAKPKTVKTVAPAPAKATPNTEEKTKEKKEKPLTPEQIEAKKSEWWARHREKSEAVKQRRAELCAVAGDKTTCTAETPIADPVLPADEDEETEEYTSKKKVEQTRICRKYGIKQKELRKAADFAKKLIASKMAAQFDSDCIFALVELMTRGDI